MLMSQSPTSCTETNNTWGCGGCCLVIARVPEVGTNPRGTAALDLTNPIASGVHGVQSAEDTALKKHMENIHPCVFLNTEVPVDERTDSSHAGWLLVSGN